MSLDVDRRTSTVHKSASDVHQILNIGAHSRAFARHDTLSIFSKDDGGSGAMIE